MSPLFVTHLHHANAIDLNYARNSLYIVCSILFLLCGLSFIFGSSKNSDLSSGDSLFSIDSTLLLKGIAIILVVLGHISQHCTEGSEALSYRITANAGVMIFLFVSGVGLAKKYRLQVDRMFWLKRAKKLAIPLWLSLILFIGLNYLILGHLDTSYHVILSFIGFFWTDFPNSPCWFITYILFFYASYFIASLIPVSSIHGRLVVLFLLPFAASWLVIATGSIDHFVLWPLYSFVFPLGVVCGLHADQLKRIIQKLFFTSTLLFYAFMACFFYLYWSGLGVHRISHLIASELFTKTVSALLNPLPLIMFIVLFIYLVEFKKLASSILEFVGKYSFELYLLHFPFMVYYDFFLFRKPLVLFFFIYLGFILVFSLVLQKVSLWLESVVFRKFKVPAF